MKANSGQLLLEAASFLPPELRAALTDAPDGSRCRDLPVRQAALLWCDISGFSRHTNTLLASRADGVEELHRELRNHYDQLIGQILLRGGEPVTFVGDGLLSVWPVGPGGMAQAVADAVATAQDFLDLRKRRISQFDLNQHISCGDIRTVELGGRHGRWLRTSVGSALVELQRIAHLKDPSEIFLTAEAAALCPEGGVSAPLGDHGACTLLKLPRARMQRKRPLIIPPPAAWDAIVARMPRSAAGWIETVGLRWLAELRPVTSVSVALPVFDQSAPHAAERLDAIVQTIQDVVHGRGGYVADVIVDEKGASVLITFGTPPDAHSDDPLRSVRSALEIIAALGRIGAAASIGVGTGRAFCSVVGNAERRSYLVLGDVVIRSTRLSAAINSGVLVDETTMRATDASIRYDADPMMLRLKGSEDPAPFWAVAANQTADTRRIAGRAEETAALRAIWARAHAGQGGAGVILEGESGFGKTSLALGLRRDVEKAGGYFTLEAASSIEQDAPFSALRRLVMESLGISSVMGMEARRLAINARLPAALREAAPLLNAVFPAGLAETAVTADLSGQARAAQIVDLVAELLRVSFEGRAACLCLDDAQWLDPASQQVLERLVATAPSLMIVVLTQPVAGTGWRDRMISAGVSHLLLGPLSQDDLRSLICLRLGCDAVEDALLNQIEARTGRHPFFSAEVVQSLHDAGALVLDGGTARLAQGDGFSVVALPDSLHGMVLQRLDRSGPAEQLSLRVASVAGLSFPTELVRDIHPLHIPDDELADLLSAQVTHGFLVAQSAGGRPGFGFTHGIVREVAHSQLPRLQSRELHGMAAEWIETHTGEDRASKLLELAHHWSEAGAQDRAVGCLLEESLRLFSQGFAVQAVQVGLRAMRAAGVEVPDGPEALGAAIGANMAAIDARTMGRHPTELLKTMSAPSPQVALRLQAILSTAPFAFQSNQFEVFAWASTAAMRLVIENGAGPPHAFSMYSIVKAALTGDRAGGAAWSRAALDLDAATGGGALPAVGFIDTWFHGHWRAPLHESVAINRAGASRALSDGDVQYASYNIAGGVILTAALGQRLDRVIAHGAEALQHRLHRNSRMQVVLEMQFARALRAETEHPLSLTGHDVTEARDIAWVAETEFANQIGYYFATRARLHRHAGDWAGAIACADQAGPLMPAIAGQTAEFDLVLHTLLARLGLVLEDRCALRDQRPAIEAALAQLAAWRAIHDGNFGAKAALAGAVWAGVQGDVHAPGRLAALARGLGPDYGLQDRALALEYAARLAPGDETLRAAVDAYLDWGATGMARRLREGAF